MSLSAVTRPGPLRRLAILAAATLAMVVIAVVAVSSQRQALSSQFEVRLMFPELADKVNEAAKIVIETRQKKATIVREGDGEDAVWKVEEKSGYDARPEMVKRTVVGLSELQLIAPRTAIPEWHPHLRLRAPDDKGAGVRIAVFDADGNTLAAIIAGKIDDETGDIGGKGRIYVRRDGENQAWLAEGSFNLEQDFNKWLDPGITDLERGRVSMVEVTPPEGRAYTLVLDGDGTAEKPAYVIADLPEGYKVRTDFAVTGVGNALAPLTFADVAPASSVTFEAPTVARFLTRDGLMVTVRTEKLNGVFWATLSAEAEEGASDMVVAEAKALDRRLSPWAFQLSSFKGIDLTRDFDALAGPIDEDAEGELQEGEAAPEARAE